ncbi:MAG: electron transfer flavoprotein subunit alpha/FixB family protein [Eggerthellaceae bacterium]|nr:electron transfer flavoprotein subunit alpha/FixB family protein [Eggerthellaceae bacterium]
MMGDKYIAVFADTVDPYNELCSGARSLGCKPLALWAGSDEDAQKIAEWGARVITFGPLPEGSIYEDVTLAFRSIIELNRPELILAPSDLRTECVAGRLAVLLNKPVINDVSEIKLDDDCVEAMHLAYGGAAERVQKAELGSIILVGAATFTTNEPGEKGTVEASEFKVKPGPFKLVETEEKQEEIVNLNAADTVVCIGRGVQNENNLELAREFAKEINAELACTRPISEGLGWMSTSRYLGVSGAVIKPKVYIGLGVSGQVQHTVGMNNSEYVVCINKDANAPFFKQCDLGLVADLRTVLPELVNLAK